MEKTIYTVEIIVRNNTGGDTPVVSKGMYTRPDEAMLAYNNLDAKTVIQDLRRDNAISDNTDTDLEISVWENTWDSDDPTSLEPVQELDSRYVPIASEQGEHAESQWTGEKAMFRLMREDLGMSQQTLAGLLGVSRMSVNRWESEGNSWNPPEEAWNLLEQRAEQFDKVVEAGYNTMVKYHGEDPERPLFVTYYRSQEQYDATHDESQPFDEINARTRQIVNMLWDEGIPVEVRYPSKGDIRLGSVQVA